MAIGYRISVSGWTVRGILFAAALILTVLFTTDVSAQSAGSDAVTNPSDKPEQKTLSKNMNIDMQLAYGQYNNMFSTISLSQETENFVYLLNSNFKRSNDFGYKDKIYYNTSYYQNNIGFTGNLNVSDGLKTIFEGSVDSNSYGMYSNDKYSREEKEKYSLSIKNTVRQSSSVEWYTSVNYAGYTHRLSAETESDSEKSRLNKLKGDFGGEYIMSSSNRIKWNGTVVWYDYSEEGICNDLSLKGEILDDFKVTSMFGMSIGINGAWDRDAAYLYTPVSGKKEDSSGTPVGVYGILGGFSLTASNVVSASVQYRSDLEPFKPESLFFDQKYVLPEYDLPPAVVHIGEAKVDVRAGDILVVKGNVILRSTDEYYNYVSNSDNVLSVNLIEAFTVIPRIEGKFKVLDSGFELEAAYEYSYFRANENITYRPIHSATGLIRYSGDNWRFEWSNKYIAKTYTEPDSDKMLPSAVIGLLGVQYRMVNGLFSYVRVENLYNTKYNLRAGYPESGVAVLGGLRILL